MTPETLKQQIELIKPICSIRKLEKEAGFTHAAINKMLDGTRQIKQADIDKLQPVLDKYLKAIEIINKK